MGVKIPVSILWGAINLLLFLLLLKYFFKGHISSFFGTRRVRLARAIKESGDLVSGAEANLNKVRARLDNVGKDGDALKELLKKEGDAERRDLVKKASEYSERLKKEVNLSTEREAKRLSQELIEEVSKMVIAIVEKRVRERMNPAVDKKIGEEFIKQLQEG